MVNIGILFLFLIFGKSFQFFSIEYVSCGLVRYALIMLGCISSIPNLRVFIMNVKVAQSCPTFCGPVNCSPPGSSGHGILQARKPKWIAISFFRESSWPRTESRSPELKADSLLSEPLGDPFYHEGILNFVKYFLCIYWDMIFIINFCNVVYHILICKCWTRDKSHMIIAYDPFTVLLSLWKFWWAFLYLCSSRILASNFLLYPYLVSV